MALFHIPDSDPHDYYWDDNGTSDDFNGPACPPEYVDPYYDADADPHPNYGTAEDGTDYDDESDDLTERFTAQFPDDTTHWFERS
jgi:hypothetical protein